MKQVMALATGVRPYIAAVVAARLAVRGTFIVQGVLLAAVLERILDGEAVGDQAGLLVGVGVVVAVRFGLTWLGEVVGQLTAAATKQDLRSRAFAKLAELGPGYTVGERTGETKAALVEGIESLESYYARYVPSLIAVGVTPLAVVAVLASQDVWLALIVVAFVVAAVALPMLWSQLLKRRGDQLMEAYLGMGAKVLDTLQGLVTLKSFGATGRQRRELATTSDRLIGGWNRVMPSLWWPRWSTRWRSRAAWR